MSNQNQEKNEKLLSQGIVAAASEGFIIAAISAISYLFAFVFEAGFAKTFDIPLSLISVSITNVFICAGSLLLIGVLMLVLLDMILAISSGIRMAVYRRVISLTPLFLLSLATVLIRIGTPKLGSTLTGLIGGWLIAIFILFGFPLLTQRDKKSYYQKLVAQDALDAQAGGILSYLARRLGVGPYFTLLSIGLALPVVYYAGESVAFRQSTFLVASTSPEMVVLRIYGDKMICAPFERDIQQVSSNFVVLRVAEDSRLVLRPEQVGPLHLKEQALDSIPSSTDVPEQSPIPTPRPP